MIAKKSIAASFVALATLMAAAPASADSLSLRFGTNGAYVGYQDGGYNWRDRGESRWRDHRRGGHDRYYGTLTPREVRQVLRDKGYREIRYLDRRGRVYEVRATNYRGQRVGLVVSARSGAILNAYRL